MKFTKAVATGNDFIIIDNRDGTVTDSIPGLAKELCRPKYSVGADGLLVIEESKIADFKMRIFNPDGSEAKMCGNGSRCVALYAAKREVAKSGMTIETLAGVLDAAVNEDCVKVKLTDPRDIKWNFCLTIGKCPYRLNFVDTGVPHVIHFVDDLENVDVKAVGHGIRHHEEFAPSGANADFVKVVGKGRIQVRTYERGVEDETLACGTGAVASAIITAEVEKAASPITVETRSGEKLKVYFEMKDNEFKNVYLEGAAKLVYDAELSL